MMIIYNDSDTSNNYIFVLIVIIIIQEFIHESSAINAV